MSPPQILVVEDEKIIARDIQNSLAKFGYEVQGAVASGEEAIQRAAADHPDLVLMDVMLEGEMDGIEAAENIHERFNIPVVFLTAYADDKTLQRAKQTEPFGYAIKPFDEKELHTTIELALNRYKLESKLRESEQWLATVLKCIDDGVIAVDHRGSIKFINAIAQTLTGWAEHEALGKNLIEVLAIVSKATREQVENPVTTVIQDGQVVSLSNDMLLTAKDGSEKEVEGSAVPIKNERDHLAGAVLVFRDITERRQMEAALQQANEKLSVRVSELEQRNLQISLLSEMADLLQACRTAEEAHAVITSFAQKLFPTASGAVYTLSASRDLAEAVAVWGEHAESERMFAPDDCWGLRRGRAYVVHDSDSDPLCAHLPSLKISTYMCVPMMAYGDTIGVLHLRSGPENPEAVLNESQRRLAITVGEHLALALANLKLRALLRNQAIRDPLTGLFNRRYMEETLEREIRRAERNGLPIGVIMFDLDHFKQFNDTFGHDAGDVLLRHLADYLKTKFRGSDFVCRYGGEEFTLILPEAPLEIARQRAEQLRIEAKQLQVQHHGQSLGPVTLSLGVAALPDHGATGEGLLRAADEALYRAKADGRDRVVVAQS